MSPNIAARARDERPESRRASLEGGRERERESAREAAAKPQPARAVYNQKEKNGRILTIGKRGSRAQNAKREVAQRI